mgnify:CR=1 FL=1|jgi:hypothetical protein
MSDKPEALRLAESLLLCWGDSRLDEAAAELRRLHAANIDCVNHFNAIKAERDELLKALDDIAAYYPNSWASDTARAAIAKASA